MDGWDGNTEGEARKVQRPQVGRPQLDPRREKVQYARRPQPPPPPQLRAERADEQRAYKRPDSHQARDELLHSRVDSPGPPGLVVVAKHFEETRHGHEAADHGVVEAVLKARHSDHAAYKQALLVAVYV